MRKARVSASYGRKNSKDCENPYNTISFMIIVKAFRNLANEGNFVSVPNNAGSMIVQECKIYFTN